MVSVLMQADTKCTFQRGCRDIYLGFILERGHGDLWGYTGCRVSKLMGRGFGICRAETGRVQKTMESTQALWILSLGLKIYRIEVFRVPKPSMKLWILRGLGIRKCGRFGLWHRD